MTRPLPFVLALSALAACAAVAACISVETYVYSAQKYDPAADCLATYTPVETVKGTGASAVCPPACLMVGSDLFVSTVCPPLPAIATAVPDDASDCKAALAAAKRGGTCDAPAEAGAEEAGVEDGAAESEAGDLDSGGEVDAADTSTPIIDAGDAG